MATATVSLTADKQGPLSSVHRRTNSSKRVSESYHHDIVSSRKEKDGKPHVVSSSVSTVTKFSPTPPENGKSSSKNPVSRTVEPPVVEPSQPETQSTQLPAHFLPQLNNKKSDRALITNRILPSSSALYASTANVGLKNLGNTCFMNSALQCLLHIEPLVSYFLGDYHTDINHNSASKGALAATFAELVKEAASAASGTTLAPTDFQKVLRAHAPHLLDYQQQDCQEFLRYLLDGMSDDLSRPRPTEADAALESKGNNNNTEDTSRKFPTMSLPGPRVELTEQHSQSAKMHCNEEPPQQPIDDTSADTPAIAAELGGSGGLVDKFRRMTARSRAKESKAEANDISAVSSSSSTGSVTVVPAPLLNTRHIIQSADKAWSRHLEKNNSIITDLFGGMLQSTVECLTCHHRSVCFDPFLDLPVPIPLKNSESSSWLRRNNDVAKCTLQDCLESFTAPEILDEENMYSCEKCKVKRKCTKKLSLFHLPRVLVVHIKRFRYTTYRREKLLTDVNFPVENLNLTPYLSPDRDPENCAMLKDSKKQCVYDLIGVAHHSGSLHGGHYVAHCDTNGGNKGKSPSWMCFNDARVSPTSSSAIMGPSAYVLFYRLKD